MSRPHGSNGPNNSPAFTKRYKKSQAAAKRAKAARKKNRK